MNDIDEAEEEERVAVWIQRVFRARCKKRQERYANRYVPGWGLATVRQLALVHWVQWWL